MPPVFPEPATVYWTCSPGQWDALLSAAYEKGHILLEIEVVDGEEKLARAWRKPAK
jgi:hypothetical protein